MINANEHQIQIFKKFYCSNQKNREEIFKNYRVSVEAFVELFPGQQINSYASGNRKITDSFIMFKVYDDKSDVCYFPVFSETVGRQMLRGRNIELPQKLSVFSNGQNKGQETTGYFLGGSNHTTDKSNYLLRTLIIFVYSIRTYNQSNPSPMVGPLKTIFDRMNSDPSLCASPSEIKSVNTVLKSFLSYTKFNSLAEYINFIKEQYPCKNIKSVDFNLLRRLFQDKYPSDSLYF